ncbi:dynamin family protein [Synechocystis salina]|uniref:Dynamin family protein n=1 Tax=Synechocystis salina LEGE 00031 TaxID=1828736 RepID=A0ABR9VQE3_9SYNC|nr:dynamin family protein [Synechocystis salina]MBE9239659.1 dynamin family protein [Synechocystis salina LEGE 00041]MBE9252698.1 dynamin family protein [Synechocystis salina LEGE 00031]
MNDSPQSAPVVNLISKIIGQPLTQQEVSPPVIFITSVLYVLNGVIFADQSVDAEEKARLEKTIADLCPEGSQARDLAYLINENVEQQGLYHNMNNLDILTQDFSESDKLLLLSLGYEMSMADGNLDKTEKRHLKTIGTFLEVDDQFYPFLESLFTDPEQLDTEILKEFKNLLDPARFHHLDEIFVVAANQILDQIPGHKKTREAKPLPRNLVDSFEELEKFKIKSYSIKGTFERIKSILDSAYQDSLISNACMNNAENISQDIQRLQEFRIAVVGDFSQGKSTLLNVLLGEEIQPVRSIPCSGTITSLKYGPEKKVICFYKDGTSETIPFSDYQSKASMDKEAALDNASQGLAEQTIEKIVVEHPNLHLCKQGIEILDSPGLNEHPERSIITQQLLNEVDGAIFLTDASRPMTQSEREVVNDVISMLNIGSNQNSANNLFVVVNKWDLLRKESDREEVKKRINNIFINNQLIFGENRIHYLSAQETLDAILEDKDNEYLSLFTNFVNALEGFLGNERGDIKIKRISDKIYSLINLAIASLDDLANILNNQSQNIGSEKEELINQIGEITGRDTKIRLMANEIRDEVIEEINDSYNEWLELLPDKMITRAQNWSSEYGAFMNRDKLIADYARQFNQDLSHEFNNWINKSLKDRILKRAIREFRKNVQDELKALEQESIRLGQSSGNLFESFNYSFNNYNLDDVGVGFGLLMTGLGAALFVPAMIFAGPILAIIGMGAGGALAGMGIGDIFGMDDNIRQKVFEVGMEHFLNTSEDIDKVNEIGYEIFDNEILTVQEFLNSLISQCDSRIKAIDKKAEQDQEQNNNLIKNINQIISDLQQISFSLD